MRYSSETDRAWKAAARCRGLDPNLFYPERGDGGGDEAKEVCRECPVQVACLEHALRFREKLGVWGGCNEADRRRIIRTRAQGLRRKRDQETAGSVGT